MSRIRDAFETLRREGKNGFIPFITAGDPNLETTGELIVELAQAGATVIELGVPFSDPMADGPVIQRASKRALAHGFGVAEILRTVSGARALTEVPIVLFSYLNPLLQFCATENAGGTPSLPVFSFEKLAREAKRSGVDGILVTDLAPEESSEFGAILRAQELDLIFLAAPTSTDARLRMIAARASGFIYAVSRAGVTGAREEISVEAERLVKRLREVSHLPIAVGFGISKREHVVDVWRYAEAAVVGSAIVEEIEKAQEKDDLVSHVREFVRHLVPEQAGK